MALFCIGLIAVAMPHVVPDKLAAPPVFETPAADTPEGEIARFDLGQTPEYPTKLDADTIAQLRAMPIGTQNGSDNAMVDSDGDDPGGHLTDQKGPILDGFNGPSALGPGPGGRDNIGVRPGTDKDFSENGPGRDFGPRLDRHPKGTPPSERTVAQALKWLARHQTPQGKWSLDFRHQCKGGTCSGGGAIQSDVAATALAILPFLGAGQTHKSKGIYRQTIAKGLTWIESQARDGCATGSWDPEKPTADAWGALGGRLVTTSLNALTLEVPYRYAALFRTDPLSRKQGNQGIPKPADAE